MRKTIILSAGKIDYRSLPFGMHESNSTIPVNGKPVISWILDDLIEEGFHDVSVVIRSENSKLKQLLEKHYNNRLKLNIVELKESKSILHSLMAGLNTLKELDKEIQIILGDTLIYDSYHNLTDTLLISTVRSSKNWCVVQNNNNGDSFNLIDKKELEGNNHIALCGYYSFSNLILLKKIVFECLQNNCNEISSILLEYNKHINLKLKYVDVWYDFGHLASFIKSKKSLLRARVFNTLTIDPLLNTIEKVSEKNDKLLDELNWYKDLPNNLKILTPRIINKNESNDHITITQEFYGYPSLSELFIYGDLNLSVWKSIIEYLIEIHQLFCTHKKISNKKDLKNIYIEKTNERIKMLRNQNPIWNEIFDFETIKLNGTSFKNVNFFLKKHKNLINDLLNINEFTIIHGDYCLSNILYDLNHQIVRLIDPRGSFGTKGIYGDPRYDIAKLRHSFIGQYDYIVADLFKIEYENGIFEYQMFEDHKNIKISMFFDDLVSSIGYDINQIKLIEALLFLTMIPYHSDYLNRQKMMYVKACELLSKIN